MSTWSRRIEVAGAALGLALLSPVLVIVVLAVRLTSPGPAIVQTRRRRKDGSIVLIYQFRKCFLNSTRETRLGRFFRAFSLDLVPACLSVLEGKLSFRDLWDLSRP